MTNQSLSFLPAIPEHLVFHPELPDNIILHPFPSDHGVLPLPTITMPQRLPGGFFHSNGYSSVFVGAAWVSNDAGYGYNPEGPYTPKPEGAGTYHRSGFFLEGRLLADETGVSGEITSFGMVGEGEIGINWRTPDITYSDFVTIDGKALTVSDILPELTDRAAFIDAMRAGEALPEGWNDGIQRMVVSLSKGDDQFGTEGDGTFRILRGLLGDDEMWIAPGKGMLKGGAGNDTLYGCDPDERWEFAMGETPDGSGSDDRSERPTVLVGGGGDDTIHYGPGKSIIRGDSGNDLITFHRGTYGRSHVLDIDGGSGDDTISACGDFDVRGGSGDDVIRAHGGSGQMSGGSGADHFELLIGMEDDYLITDFDPEEDSLHVETDMLIVRFDGTTPVYPSEPDLVFLETEGGLVMEFHGARVTFAGLDMTHADMLADAFDLSGSQMLTRVEPFIPMIWPPFDPVTWDGSEVMLYDL